MDVPPAARLRRSTDRAQQRGSTLSRMVGVGDWIVRCPSAATSTSTLINTSNAIVTRLVDQDQPCGGLADYTAGGPRRARSRFSASSMPGRAARRRGGGWTRPPSARPARGGGGPVEHVLKRWVKGPSAYQVRQRTQQQPQGRRQRRGRCPSAESSPLGAWGSHVWLCRVRRGVVGSWISASAERLEGDRCREL